MRENLNLKTAITRWPICLLMIFYAAMAFGQSSITLSGKVINEKDEPIPQVTVLAEGNAVKEKHTTVTDNNGVFIFKNLKQGVSYSITASFIGYQSQTLPSAKYNETDNSIPIIRLQPSTREMDQVVVIGYGVQKREMVTGSIATIKAENFNKGVITDPLTLISGKVAGLAITRPNGSDPNASADFSLRGAVSVEGSSQPLIVIDGVPGGDINTIAPADIASIDVLRDGSAAAIYGSRATGGVIIITTKKGNFGPTRVSYNGYVSTEKVAKKYNILNAAQYRKFASDNGLASNDQNGNTDWFAQLTRVPYSHGHNISFSGGGGKTTYNASLNYQHFQGIDISSDREFVNGTILLNTKAINDKLDVSIFLANSFDNKYFAEYYGFGQALIMNPTYPVYDSAGNYFETPGVANGSQWNPVANTKYNTNNQKEKRLLATSKFIYSILPWLRASVSYSLHKIDLLSGSYTNTNLLYQQTSGLNGQASRNESNTTDNILETTIELDKRIKDHSFNFIGGYSYQDEFAEGLGAGNNNFGTNAYSYYNLGAGQAVNTLDPSFNRGGAYVSSYGAEWTLLSYFGRLIYNYKERYLFNASIRREGASKLGASNKWANFPGISAGWIISKESFMDNITSIKNLKIRAGYGITGNQQGLVPYQSLATLGPWPYGTMRGYMGTPGNGSWVTAYGPTINANPDLKWETKKELDMGVDFTLFKNGWLNGSFDYYSRRIEDLIGNYIAQVPSQIWPLIYANAGVMTNKGVELTLNAQLVKNKNFSWNATFVGAHNSNMIVSISNDQFHGTAHPITQINGWGTEVQRMAPGQPVSVFYGKVFAGFTPDSQWLFRNNKGLAVTSDKITDQDYAYLGNSIPAYNFGLTNSFVFKNIDLSILFRSAMGFKVLNAKRIFHENINQFAANNLFVSALNSPVKGEPTFSSYYLEKGDYLKIDNLTIGYSLPVHKSFYIQRVRVSLTATNLVTITGFSGIDPELGLSPYNNTGVERNDFYYPRTRTFTLAVNADF